MKTDYSSITKFQQLVELKDFKPPTRQEYVRYVRRLATWCGGRDQHPVDGRVWQNFENGLESGRSGGKRKTQREPPSVIPGLFNNA